jgi:hypothetical protein
MSWITVGVSAGSAIWGGIKAGKARKEQKGAEAQLERLAQNSPLRKESKALNDYYQEALNRYNENPYQSAAYQQAMQNARRTTASGLGALQDRRSAIGGISRLGSMESGASQRAVAQGEQMQAQRFNQLGQATQMKKRDEDELFDINKMTPYQRKLQLEQMKGAAAGERYNAGMQMLGQSLSNAAAGGLQYMESNPGQNPFKGLFGNKSNSSSLSNASLSSDIIGMPGYQQQNSSALSKYFKTRKPKSL